ncbi:MAG: hypothetical protein M1817_003298 [Caeruleum heppii]|nr:MAG: hypothetical protein M1817_003298 [Caeruleum heppii]
MPPATISPRTLRHLRRSLIAVEGGFQPLVVPVRSHDIYASSSHRSWTCRGIGSLARQPSKNPSTTLRQLSSQHRNVQLCPRPEHSAWAALSTQQLYERLDATAAKGRVAETQALVHHLVRDRGQEPNARLYDALIHSNVDPAKGSVDEIRSLFGEMRDHGITSDSKIYHSILKVLAIHPDYLFRNSVLDEMRQRWFQLTPEGWHSLVAGLLRDRMFERARDKLDEMRREGVPVEGWLQDVFIHHMLDRDEIDESLHLLQQRTLEDEDSASVGMWYALLDRASACYHHSGTVYAWRKQVEPNHLIPSDGMCMKVLHTAVRHGDTDLAADVFRVLGNRGTKFQPYEYEALLEAYAMSGDYQTALTILSFMKDAGQEPQPLSTRSIVQVLCEDRERPLQALRHLRSLGKNKRTVPAAAVNCIIDSYVKLGDLTTASELYQRFHTVCESGPNTETFDILIGACRLDDAKERALFFASEMRAMKLRPTKSTYEGLILTCLKRADCRLAHMYWEESRDVGFRLGPELHIKLVRGMAETRDNRAFDVAKAAQDVHIDGLPIRRWLRQEWARAQTGRTGLMPDAISAPLTA